MANTITEYNTFVASTKARAAQVNTNFSNHRGTLVPINTDTATASDLTHDLGTTDHRWRVAYVDEVRFAGDTTAGIYIGTTAGGAMCIACEDTLDFKIDTNTVASWSDNNVEFRSKTGQQVFQVGTNGAQLISTDGDTMASWAETGADGNLIQTQTIQLISMAQTGFTTSGVFSDTTTVTSFATIAGSQITITGSGRPLIVMVTGHTTTSEVAIEAINSQTTAQLSARIYSSASSITAQFQHQGGGAYAGGAAAGAATWKLRIPPSSIWTLDAPPFGTTVVYEIQYGCGQNDNRVSFTNCELRVYKL